MALIAHKAHLGNLRVVDVRRDVDRATIARDMQHLALDPYVPEGFRRKGIARFRFDGGNRFARVAHEPLLQSRTVNPTHGGIERVYPEYVPDDPYSVYAVRQVLRLFSHWADLPQGEEVLLQAQRISCGPDLKCLPSVEGWHRDGVTKIGVLCIDRCNVSGGTSLFRRSVDGPTVPALRMTLEPGHLVVFQDEPVSHRVTEIRSKDGIGMGHRDVLLMSYPASSRG